MRILIVSALFPPDIAPPAPYIKELAARLGQSHQVTVLTYGAIPEAVATARIFAVPKRLSAPLRLIMFSSKLWWLGWQHERILIHNAPATELPLLLAGFWFRRKSWLVVSDHKIIYTGWRHLLHRLAERCVTKTVHPATLPERPEVHPFKPVSPDAPERYEAAWQTHLSLLTTPNTL